MPFADDIDQIRESNIGLHTHLEPIWQALKGNGLRIDREKTDHMTFQSGTRDRQGGPPHQPVIFKRNSTKWGSVVQSHGH